MLALVQSTTLSYHGALCAAMALCAAEKNAIFLGQGVANAGTSMSSTFDSVPMDRRLEMPVAEDMQMGMAIGMSLAGYLPICVFPRWNFVLCAANQIINHLDRLPLYSDYKPKVIIRTAVPSVSPFNPGPQHDDDFSLPFHSMLRTVRVVRMRVQADVIEAYQSALKRPESTILVEYTDRYREARAHG